MKTNELFMSATEISEVTGMSEAYAYKIIRELNKELEAKGYMTIRGRVSKDYFQERIYGVKEMKWWTISNCVFPAASPRLLP